MSTDTESWLFPDRTMDDYIRAVAGRETSTPTLAEDLAQETRGVLDSWVTGGFVTREDADAFAERFTFPTSEEAPADG